MKSLIACLVLVSSPVWAADKLQTLDVKLGLWETTTTGMSSGELPIPPDMLEKMTPEQRAKFEQAMKSRMGAPSTNTHRYCLTKEKLEKDLSFGADRPNCTHQVVSSSSSAAEVKVHCTEQNSNLDGTVKVQASNSENVKASMHMTVSGSGKNMNVDTNMTSHWISSSCGDVK